MKQFQVSPPRLISWEVTQACNLRCAHCRASAEDEIDPLAFDTERALEVIDQILEVGKPLLILTGGEPLMRPDIFDLAAYASEKGLPLAMGTNGTLITPNIAKRMKEVFISRLSISIDFPTAEMQDRFRGLDGAFNDALNGIRNARHAGIDVQINCTITKMNLPYLDDIVSLAIKEGAMAFHPFLLVPTGRGKELKNVNPSINECERVFRWIHKKSAEMGDRILFKPTCAPFYQRIILQSIRKPPPLQGEVDMECSGFLRQGCLAGTGFCFISHTGQVQGCGYLDLEAGNINNQRFTNIWQSSYLFTHIRNLAELKGKCGVCQYRNLCGGCRARAYETTGDYLESEPLCIYRPPATRK